MAQQKDHIGEVNKMITAVEYLVSIVQSCIAPDYIPIEIVKQAKEMEKEQIIDAYQEGEDNVDNDGCTISKNGADRYYNETFKKD